MATIYVFSGLGVDKRVFANINFGNNIVVHINWVTPPKNCSIQQYAQLVSKQIDTQKPILIGLSFGGIMAIEVAKVIPISTIILISSVKTMYELPLWIRLSGFCKLYTLLHFIPNKLVTKPNALVYAAFGIKAKKEKELLQQIMADINPIFLRWAIKQIACWQNKETPKNFFHIHGTKDGIFPIYKISNTIAINNAGHFMIRNKLQAVNKVLKDLLPS